MPDIVGNDLKFIRLNDKDLIGKCMSVGYFEGNNITKASELLYGNTDGVVLDIGANMGSFTIPLAYHLPHFSFVCFEPQRMVYYQLCGNVALNSLRNVRTFNQGLGEHDEFFRLPVPDYSQEENIGAFSLDEEVRNHDDYLCKTNGHAEQIVIAPLDSFQIGNVRLIKIDVEGMELSVLKGGIETIKHNNYPPIMFEAWTHKDWFLPRRKELFEFLENLGYEITQMGEDNIAIYKGESK
jgi:FkbM family methyltransferase